MFLYDRWYRTKDRVVRDNKWNATRLVTCGLTGFECFVACDSMNALDLVLEEKEIVSTVVNSPWLCRVFGCSRCC